MKKKVGFLVVGIVLLSVLALLVCKRQGHEENSLLSYAKSVAEGKELKEEQYEEIKTYLDSSEESSEYEFLAGVVAYAEDDYQKAVKKFSSAAEKIRQKDDDFIKIYTYVLLNESLQAEGKTEHLEQNSQKALKYMAASKTYRNDMELCWRIATIFLENQEDNHKGTQILESYVTDTAGLTDESKVRLYGNIAQLYSSEEDYSAALQYCWRGIELLDSSPFIPNHSKYMSKFYTVLGDNAYALEQYQTAIEYYDQSMEIFRKSKTDTGTAEIGLALINKGTAYLELGQEEKVRPVLKELDELLPELAAAQRDDIEILQGNLRAQLEMNEGDFEQAEKELETAKELLKTDDVEYSLDKEIYLDYSYARLYKSQGRFEEALSLYQQVIKQSEEAGLGLEKNIYYDMAEIYIKQDNKEAYVESREQYAHAIKSENQQLSADYIEYSEKVYQYYSLMKKSRIRRVIISVVSLLGVVLLADTIFLLIKWRKKSYTDHMSRLYNREYLTEYMRRKKKKMTAKPLSLLMIDIDYFKQYNDYYGHVKGDAGIKALAETLSDSVRRKDLVIRYGGEEMLVLLRETTAEGARSTAERIRKNLADKNIPHKKSPVSERLTVSMGIYTTCYNGEDIFEWIEKADELLYQAKRKGRDCYVCGEAC